MPTRSGRDRRAVNSASLDPKNLKKRAKTVLRQHAARHVPVAERIRRALPAFVGRSDREVLAAPFTLAQAQELIAREHAFTDWAHLEEPCRHDRNRAYFRPRPLQILAASRRLFVADVTAPSRSTATRLGFAVDYLYEHRPPTAS